MDGSWFSNSSTGGLGYLIRNESGSCWLVAAAYVEASSMQLTKLLALKYALIYQRNCPHYSNLTLDIEIDCKRSISLIKGSPELVEPKYNSIMEKKNS